MKSFVCSDRQSDTEAPKSSLFVYHVQGYTVDFSTAGTAPLVYTFVFSTGLTAWWDPENLPRLSTVFGLECILPDGKACAV